jgi:antitoxin HicB
MFRYAGIFEACPDIPGSYTVTIPDVPEVVTQGEGLADAKEMAADALELILSSYIEKGRGLPTAKARKGRNGHWIVPSALAQIKLALYVEFRKARISKADLARKMGIAKQQVDRLFDLQHSSRVEQIELPFSALGKVIAISIEDAA